MEAKHTPGPWEAIGCIIEPVDRKMDIAEVFSGDADARLIALAPEMLQFVKDACAEMDCASGLRQFGETILARVSS